MAASARIVIKGQNELKQPLKQAQSDLSSFADVAANIGDKLKKAFKIGSIAVAIEKVTKEIAECVSEFNTADRAYKQLSLSLNDPKGFNAVKKNISQLSKISLSGKDDIEAMASELAALGKSSDEINKISEAAVHLSNVTGKDLNSSMTTLLNTYNGNTKQLQKLGIDTSNLTKEELAEGAAVDMLIEKYGELSRKMAEDDTAQHIKNIKDNLGDIRQSLGQIVDAALKPLIRWLDDFSAKAKDKIQDFADTVTVVIENIPVIWEKFISSLGSSLEHFWKRISSIEGIKAFIDGIIRIVTNRIKLIGNIIANLADLIINVISTALEGLGNLAMSWIVGVCDSMGINISEVINSIGDWLLESPIGKIVDQILSKVINGIRLIGALIKNIPGILKIVFSYLGDLITEFVNSFPSTMLHVLKGLGNKILEGIQNIKNSFLQTVEDALNSIGEWIQSTWVGKAMKWMGLDLGDKLANIDFGIDRTKQYEYASKADSEFAAAKESFSGVTEIGKEMADEITKLLNPTIEKWKDESSETIGQKLATWTAKSSDEYLEAAKKNFKDIGSFLKDWGQNFLGDLDSDWTELSESMSDMFTDMFGDDMGQFVDWFKEYIKELKLQKSEGEDNGGSGGSGGGSDTSTEQQATLLGTVFDDLKQQAGEAGEFVTRLGQNMSALGPVLGAIATLLHYVIQGLMEGLGDILSTFVKYGIEPLREFGRIIADALVPLFDAIMPSIADSATILVEVFTLIGKVLKPIVTTIGNVLGPILSKITQFIIKLLPIIRMVANVFIGIASVIEWVGQWIGHLIASVVNWAGGWLGIHVNDPGDPGDLATFISDRLAEADSPNSSFSVDTSSKSTGTTNASYSGGTVIHLNVYQQGVVCGDNGILEFATMIKNELADAQYLGR